MSETAPEAQPRSSGGNVFTRKVGPLSLWVWMLIALVLAGVYYLYKKNSANSANSSTANAASGNSPGGVDASLVPQFINQTYNQTEPPVAPNITVNNTIPTDNDNPPPVDNDQPPPRPTTKPPSPKQPQGRPTAPFEPIFNGSYTVKKGETLQQVATKFHISREQLAHANGLGTGAGLRTGQKLRVPVPAPAGKPNKAI